MRKKILLVSRHAPYGNSLAREAVDAALAAAIYDQDLSVLFMDDGVFQLLKNQSAQEIQQKDFSSMLSAFPLYDIENIYLHKESLEQRRITSDELILEELCELNNSEVASLLNQQDHILSF